MRKEWDITHLGEICEIYQPKTISSKEMNANGKYLVYGANGIIGRYNQYNHKESQLLITCRGATCGSVNISEEKSWINGNAMVLKPKNESLSIKFLEYFFRGGIDISKCITGAAQPQITRQSLSPVKITYPKSLLEQDRIVAILDETFAAIDKAKANTEKNLQNAKDLFESYLQNVFANPGVNWERRKLSEIATTFGRGKSKHRPRNDKRLYGGKYPFVQTGDVRNSNKYISSYSQTYNEFGLSQSKLWPRGTICITIAANIAETGILDFDSCFPDSIIGLVIDDKKVDLSFTYYVLQYLKAELKLKGKGSAQDNINLGTFEGQFFPFPPIKKQKIIVEILNSLSSKTQKLEAIYQQKLNYLEELRKSVLQKAFAGEIEIKLEII